MEFLIVTVGILLVLIVTAAVMDIRARRRRHRLSVDRLTLSKAETSAVVNSSGTSRTAAAFTINSCPPMLGPLESA